MLPSGEISNKFGDQQTLPLVPTSSGNLMVPNTLIYDQRFAELVQIPISLRCML